MDSEDQDRYSFWPPDLIRAFHNRQVVLFIGSGLSSQAKSGFGRSAPSWQGLLEHLKKQAEEKGLLHKEDRKRELERIIKNGSPDDYQIAAEYLKDKFDNGNEDLKLSVSQLLSKFSPGLAHQIVGRLPVAGYISTNYDTYLETVFASEHMKPLQVYSANSLDALAIATMETHSPWLIKMHGQIGTSENFVLSYRDYEEAYASGRIETLFTTILSRYTILFIGFGFRDPPIMSALRSSFLKLGKNYRRHYAFSDNQTLASIKSRFLQKHFNVHTIRYPSAESEDEKKQNQKHRNFSVWLKQLEKAVRMTRPPSVRVLMHLRFTGETNTTYLYKARNGEKDVFLWPSIEWHHQAEGNGPTEFTQASFRNAIRDQFNVDSETAESISISRISRTFIDEDKVNIAHDNRRYDFHFQFLTIDVSAEYKERLLNFFEVTMPEIGPWNFNDIMKHKETNKYNKNPIHIFQDL
ncbi:SIR2 family protein [Pseudooceanicola sp. C21-150M6]|uniref:SIR2 family protein n=1 Tax=Pseudooceanicola sp. C21-150M6 TaxID=3434355 RepID=UPI003D7F236D